MESVEGEIAHPDRSYAVCAGIEVEVCAVHMQGRRSWTLLKEDNGMRNAATEGGWKSILRDF